MSNRPSVAVIVGAPPEFHFTPVNVAVVGVPDAGCLSNKVNDFPAVAVGIVNVQAVADVNVAVKTVPAVIAKVADAPTVPLATMVSVYAVGVKLSDEVRVVNAPVLGVVAPTVPLMLIDAVPVKFVTVPLDGVPKAPPLVNLALKVDQSVDVKYPFTDAVAAAIEIAGVVPPDDTTGAEPVTEVTVPVVGVVHVGVAPVPADVKT
tara:strand:+ start:1578 stop:2192 length:615 start_codon:yes stop_codon:yes gene_type:complete